MVEMPIFDLGSFGWAGVADDTYVNRGERARKVSEVCDASLHPTSHTVKSHGTIRNLADIQRVPIASQGPGARALAVESTVEVKPQLVVLAYQAHMRPLVDLYGLLRCQALAEVAHAGNTEAYLTSSVITSKEELRDESHFTRPMNVCCEKACPHNNQPEPFLTGLSGMVDSIRKGSAW